MWGLAVCWSLASRSAAPVVLSWLVIAETIVALTLNALSCFFRSDFAALGAFLSLLVELAKSYSEYILEQFNDRVPGTIPNHPIGILEQLHEVRHERPELQSIFDVHLSCQL